jgi:hypothetical protein
MDTWGKELIVGIEGSLIGAAIVYLFSVGFQWTQKSREARQKVREKEIADWKSGSAVKRQTITNLYLFSVLKFFMIGSILMGVASAVGDLEPNLPGPGLLSEDYVQEVLDIVATIFYLATFAKIIQFTKLLRMRS